MEAKSPLMRIGAPGTMATESCHGLGSTTGGGKIASLFLQSMVV